MRPAPAAPGALLRLLWALAEVPELPEELVWELLLDELPERGLRAALASGAVPRFLLAKVGDRWLDLDHPAAPSP